MIRVALLGAGNVAWSLAPAIAQAKGYSLVQIYNRSLERAAELAERCGDSVSVTDHIDSLEKDADIYVIALTDSALRDVVAELAPQPHALWLHTSGGVEASILSRLSERYGVMYPMQTFTRGINVDVRQVPVFVEGSSPSVLDEVERFAAAISDRVSHSDSDARRRLHTAAVFACNFTNYLWTVASDLLKRDNLPLSVLRPLIDETLRKAMTIGPELGQTGPARRGDIGVMDAHLRSLPEEYRGLYASLSRKIMNRYNIPLDEQDKL